MWAAEAMAVGKPGTNGQVVKVSVLCDHQLNATERQQLRVEAVGLFRRRYGAWPNSHETAPVKQWEVA